MMRSAEKGELYEQLPEAAQSQVQVPASPSPSDTISTAADGLVTDGQ
jgi:hypothetical protein